MRMRESFLQTAVAAVAAGRAAKCSVIIPHVDLSEQTNGAAGSDEERRQRLVLPRHTRSCDTSSPPERLVTQTPAQRSDTVSVRTLIRFVLTHFLRTENDATLFPLCHLS